MHCNVMMFKVCIVYWRERIMNEIINEFFHLVNLVEINKFEIDDE